MSSSSPNKHTHPHSHSHSHFHPRPHKHLPPTPPPSSPLTTSPASPSYPPSPIHTASPHASTSASASPTSSIPVLAHLPLPSPLYAHSNRSTTSTSSQSTVQPRGGPPSPALSALSTPSYTSYTFRRAAAPWSKSKSKVSVKSLSGKSVSSDSLAMEDWAWQRAGQTQGQAHGLGLGKVPMGGLAGSPARSEVSEGKRTASGQLLGSIGKGLGRVGSVMKRGESIRRNNRDRAGGSVGAVSVSGARRKASKESSKDLTVEPVVEESEEWERLSGDDGIGRPFNVEHELHVSPDLEDLPAEWLNQLKSQGMSESDLLLISAARKKQIQSASATKLKLIPIRKKCPPPFLPEMPRLTSMDDMSDDEYGIQAGTSASTSASTSDISAGGPFTPILPAEEPASPALPLPLPSPSSPSPSSQSREGGGQGGAHGGRSSVYSSPSSRTTPRSKRLSDQLRGFAAIPITSELGWADEVVLAMDKRSPLASVSETETMPLSASDPHHGLNSPTSTSPSSRLIPSSPRSAKSIRRIPVPKDDSPHSVTRTQSTSPRLGSSPSPSSRLDSPSSPGQAIPWPRSPPPPPPKRPTHASATVSPPASSGAIGSTLDDYRQSSIRKSSDSFGVHYSTSAPTTTRAPPPGPLILPDPHLDRDEVLAHAGSGPVGGHRSTSASASTWRRNGHPPTPEPFTSRPPLSPFPFPLDPPMPLGARERKHNSVPASAAATSRSGTPISRPTSPGSTSTRESFGFGFDNAGARSPGTAPAPTAEDIIARFRAALATPTPSGGHGHGHGNRNGNSTDDRASLALSMMSGDSRDSLRDIGHATVLQAYTAKIKLGHLREVSESDGDGERDSGHSGHSGHSGQGGVKGDGTADEDGDEDDEIVSAYSRESDLDDDDDNDDGDEDDEEYGRGHGDEYRSRRDRARPEFGAMDALNRAARHLAREACH